MKLQDTQYYTGNFKIESYKKAQVARHKSKSYKKRVAKEYQICAEQVKDLIPTDAKMLCLGTRNNHERDIFSEALSIRVFSQDIAKASGADYIGDFNRLSGFVSHDWDIIYSNSIDHAANSTKAFFEWMRVLKTGGIMILGFGLDDQDVGPCDCNGFNESTVDNFMKNKSNIYKYVKSFDAVDYKYWMVKKLELVKK